MPATPGNPGGSIHSATDFSHRWRRGQNPLNINANTISLSHQMVLPEQIIPAGFQEVIDIVLDKRS